MVILWLIFLMTITWKRTMILVPQLWENIIWNHVTEHAGQFNRWGGVCSVDHKCILSIVKTTNYWKLYPNLLNVAHNNSESWGIFKIKLFKNYLRDQPGKISVSLHLFVSIEMSRTTTVFSNSKGTKMAPATTPGGKLQFSPGCLVKKPKKTSLYRRFFFLVSPCCVR